jgi:outer membrane murein-binding lipoprotein Lpp
MKLTKVTIFLSTCLLFAGCSKTDNTSNTSTKVNTSNTAAATASPKATTEAVASPSATTAQSKVAKPEDAANGLLKAWKTKDRTEAAKFATEDAYTKLFTEGGGPEGMESQGCSNEKGVYNCGYTYPGGALIMIVNGSEAAGYKVNSIVFVAD